MLQLAEPDEVQEFMMPILNGLFSGCALRSVNLFKVQFYSKTNLLFFVAILSLDLYKLMFYYLNHFI